MDIDKVKFDSMGLVPAIAQDADTGQVLMLAYMNREALELTLKTREAHYFSRSRQTLWHKGETSGHVQRVLSMAFDCDFDAVLLHVEQTGCACHTGNMSCFFNAPEGAPANSGAHILRELAGVIADRRKNPVEGSYTNYLLGKGRDKILKKVGEESAEVIIAAKNGSKDELRYETADLLYHLLVLLENEELPLEDIYAELKSRR